MPMDQSKANSPPYCQWSCVAGIHYTQHYGKTPTELKFREISYPLHPWFGKLKHVHKMFAKGATFCGNHCGAASRRLLGGPT